MNNKLNIINIVKEHAQSLSMIPFNFNTLIKGEFFHFIWIPLFVSAVICTFFKAPTNETLSYISTILSIFIGLFLNLLVFLFPFIDNPHKVKDTKNRYLLIKETFYNISFVIILCILSLIIVFSYGLSFSNFIKNKTYSIKYFEEYIFILHWGKLFFLKIQSFLIYFSLIEIFLTLLMIMKRVTKLFATELKHASEDIIK